MEIPEGQTAANRTDLEILITGLPQPIDIDLDLDKRLIFWTVKKKKKKKARHLKSCEKC